MLTSTIFASVLLNLIANCNLYNCGYIINFAFQAVSMRQTFETISKKRARYLSLSLSISLFLSLSFCLSFFFSISLVLSLNISLFLSLYFSLSLSLSLSLFLSFSLLSSVYQMILSKVIKVRLVALTLLSLYLIYMPPVSVV